MGMLVLSRHRGESIELADGLITIMIVGVRGDKVRVGIDAPDDVTIHRSEIQRRIDGSSEALSEDTGAPEALAASATRFKGNPSRKRRGIPRDTDGDPIEGNQCYLVQQRGDVQARWIKVYEVNGVLKCRPAGMQVAGFLAIEQYADARWQKSESGVTV